MKANEFDAMSRMFFGLAAIALWFYAGFFLFLFFVFLITALSFSNNAAEERRKEHSDTVQKKMDDWINMEKEAVKLAQQDMPFTWTPERHQ